MEKSLNVSDELASFIQSAKTHGISDSFTVALLRKNGWSEQRVFRAFTAFYTGALGVPIPAKGGRSENARDAFYYLLNFISLGFWTVALGQIFYTLIARWVPDAAQVRYVQMALQDQLAWQLATILITFPVFAFVHRLIGAQLAQRPDLYDSGVRKWLTYIALVGASLIVLTDGIWFLEALLRGQLTQRFVLDSLVLLVIGGGVFSYYLATIDGPKREA